MWALASARRLGFPTYAIISWTLGTLFFPFIVFPIFLIVRVRGSNSKRSLFSTEAQSTANQNSAREENNQGAESQDGESSTVSAQVAPSLRWRFLLPVLYLLAVLSARAYFYHRDFESVDVHLARANQARLMGQRARTIREYRAALRLENNPHTHNLLARELFDAKMLEEALAEFRAAEREHEPDDELAFRIANTLDALNRRDESLPEYEKFLDSSRCRAQGFPDPLCATARARVSASSPGIVP